MNTEEWTAYEVLREVRKILECGEGESIIDRARKIMTIYKPLTTPMPDTPSEAKAGTAEYEQQIAELNRKVDERI